MRTTHHTIRQVRRAVGLVALVSGASLLALAAIVSGGLAAILVLIEVGSSGSYPVLAGAVLAALCCLAFADLCLERTLLRAGLWVDHVLEPCLLKAGLASADPASALLDTNRWLGELRDSLIGGQTRVLVGLPLQLGSLAGLMVIDPVIGATGFAFYLLALTLATFGALSLARRNLVRTARARDVRRGVVAAAAGGHALVGLGLAEYACRTGAARNRRWIAAAFRSGRLETSMVAAVRLMLTIGLLTVASLVIFRVQSGTLAVPLALAVLPALAVVLSPLVDMTRAIHAGLGALEAWRRLSDVALDATAHRLFTAPGTVLNRAATLTLSDVDFGYAFPDQIIRRTSFTIGRSEAIALHGAPGAGKSSVLALLAGGRAPSGGLVLFGDEPVGPHQSTTGRPSVGWLMDEPMLVEGTVAANIQRFVDDEPATLHAAIRRAGVAGIIATLADGLDTWVSRDGRSLSLAQRRAVALARALHGNPAFLILDEPETGLDEASVAILAGSLQRLKEAGTGICLVTRHPALLGVADHSVLLSGRTLVPIIDGARRWPLLAANDPAVTQQQAG